MTASGKRPPNQFTGPPFVARILAGEQVADGHSRSRITGFQGMYGLNDLSPIARSQHLAVQMQTLASTYPAATRCQEHRSLSFHVKVVHARASLALYHQHILRAFRPQQSDNSAFVLQDGIGDDCRPMDEAGDPPSTPFVSCRSFSAPHRTLSTRLPGVEETLVNTTGQSSAPPTMFVNILAVSTRIASIMFVPVGHLRGTSYLCLITLPMPPFLPQAGEKSNTTGKAAIR
jgi:hypothetical protein